MKRTVAVRDAVEEEPGDAPEQKRVKEHEEHVDAVLELSADDFECVICCDLMVDPVVSKCGHDFCRFCMEQVFNAARRRFTNPSCPVCRTALARQGGNTDLGVCIRLKELIERLFPRRSKKRRAEVEIDRQREQAKAQQEAAQQAANRSAAAAAAGGSARGTWHDVDEMLNLLHQTDQHAFAYPGAPTYPGMPAYAGYGAGLRGSAAAAAAGAGGGGGGGGEGDVLSRGIARLSEMRQQIQRQARGAMQSASTAGAAAVVSSAEADAAAAEAAAAAAAAAGWVGAAAGRGSGVVAGPDRARDTTAESLSGRLLRQQWTEQQAMRLMAGTVQARRLEEGRRQQQQRQQPSRRVDVVGALAAFRGETGAAPVEAAEQGEGAGGVIAAARAVAAARERRLALRSYTSRRAPQPNRAPAAAAAGAEAAVAGAALEMDLEPPAAAPAAAAAAAAALDMPLGMFAAVHPDPAVDWDELLRSGTDLIGSDPDDFGGFAYEAAIADALARAHVHSRAGSEAATRAAGAAAGGQAAAGATARAAEERFAAYHTARVGWGVPAVRADPAHDWPLAAAAAPGPPGAPAAMQHGRPDRMDAVAIRSAANASGTAAVAAAAAAAGSAAHQRNMRTLDAELGAVAAEEGRPPGVVRSRIRGPSGPPAPRQQRQRIVPEPIPAAAAVGAAAAPGSPALSRVVLEAAALEARRTGSVGESCLAEGPLPLFRPAAAAADSDGDEADSARAQGARAASAAGSGGAAGPGQRKTRRFGRIMVPILEAGSVFGRGRTLPEPGRYQPFDPYRWSYPYVENSHGATFGERGRPGAPAGVADGPAGAAPAAAPAAAAAEEAVAEREGQPTDILLLGGYGEPAAVDAAVDAAAAAAAAAGDSRACAAAPPPAAAVDAAGVDAPEKEAAARARTGRVRIEQERRDLATDVAESVSGRHLRVHRAEAAAAAAAVAAAGAVAESGRLVRGAAAAGAAAGPQTADERPAEVGDSQDVRQHAAAAAVAVPPARPCLTSRAARSSGAAAAAAAGSSAQRPGPPVPAAAAAPPGPALALGTPQRFRLHTKGVSRAGNRVAAAAGPVPPAAVEAAAEGGGQVGPQRRQPALPDRVVSMRPRGQLLLRRASDRSAAQERALFCHEPVSNGRHITRAPAPAVIAGQDGERWLQQEQQRQASSVAEGAVAAAAPAVEAAGVEVPPAAPAAAGEATAPPPAAAAAAGAEAEAGGGAQSPEGVAAALAAALQNMAAAADPAAGAGAGVGPAVAVAVAGAADSSDEATEHVAAPAWAAVVAPAGWPDPDVSTDDSDDADVRLTRQASVRPARQHLQRRLSQRTAEDRLLEARCGRAVPAAAQAAPAAAAAGESVQAGREEHGQGASNVRAARRVRNREGGELPHSAGPAAGVAAAGALRFVLADGALSAGRQHLQFHNGPGRHWPHVPRAVAACRAQPPVTVVDGGYISSGSD